jgi:hypothetical protein
VVILVMVVFIGRNKQQARLSNCWGSLDFTALWLFVEGLFLFYKYFFKKEGFLKVM